MKVLHIFDFDDTIVFSEKMKKDVFFNFSKQYNQIGISYYNNFIDKGLSRQTYLQGLSEIIIKHSLVDNNSAKFLYNLLLEKFNDTIKNNLKISKLVPNVDAFIKYLYDKNYALYISSKSNEQDIISTLKHKNLLQYFKGIYGLPYSKNIHFKLIRETEQIEGKNICFFGDSSSMLFSNVIFGHSLYILPSFTSDFKSFIILFTGNLFLLYGLSFIFSITIILYNEHISNP